MVKRPITAAACGLLAAHLAAQAPARTIAPRLWSDQALADWALPIAGANATPTFYSEAEYYAAPVDERRTYPMYAKDREPKGYRESLLRRGPQPLIEIGRARTDAEWIAAGREVFAGMDLPENRTDAPEVLEWVNDPDAPARDEATVAKDGTLVSMRWVVDRDGRLKVTIGECTACHTRILPDGTEILGAQGNMNLGMPLFDKIFAHADRIRVEQDRSETGAQLMHRSFAVPWLTDDVNLRFRTMSAEELKRFGESPLSPGTFPRFNGSPFFTNRIPDLIGVSDRVYLDATATHRNRGPEDIGRYAILVTDADDGTVGPHRVTPDNIRKLHNRHSDDAMYALGKYVYSLQPPPNPNAPSPLSHRGQEVFNRTGCGNCHTPPLYTNNKLVPVDGFARLDHPQSPPVSDVLAGARLGLDPGLALKTRKGTGYYKVPSLKGLWYRDTLEHSGSIASLEEWFDPARIRAGYRPKGWNPPGVETRAVPGHPFGLALPPDDKKALIAFLRTL